MRQTSLLNAGSIAVLLIDLLGSQTESERDRELQCAVSCVDGEEIDCKRKSFGTRNGNWPEFRLDSLHSGSELE